MLEMLSGSMVNSPPVLLRRRILVVTPDEEEAEFDLAVTGKVFNFSFRNTPSLQI